MIFKILLMNENGKSLHLLKMQAFYIQKS